jgi:hypothetical protein
METNEVKIKKIVHRADSRGRSKFDWLDSKHNFSFAGYFHPERTQFGALRVLNDDIVQPGAGFGRHPHDNMEIISIPLKGSLMHQDSMGHSQEIKVDEVQVMSAGTGIFHSEFNASDSEEVNFLQLWIIPKKRSIEPVYGQRYFDPAASRNAWQTLVTGVDDPDSESLKIYQDATISRSMPDAGSSLIYKSNPNSFGSFLFVVHGEIEIEGEIFNDRDAVGIVNPSQFKIKAKKNSYIINIEVPGEQV